MDKISLYYYNKDNGWTYIHSKNSTKRRVLTGGLRSLEAVCILQDNVPPRILSTFPGNGGLYDVEDVSIIEANVDDILSGIEPAESEMSMILDGKQLISAYQPVKQKISYELSAPLNVGGHSFIVFVKDRSGNKAEKHINFKIK